MSKSKKESNATNVLNNNKSQLKIKRQLVSKNEMKSKQRFSLPQISPSTQKLKMKIYQFKTQKLALTKTLQQSIKNNLKCRSNSASQLQKYKNLQFLDKKHNTKQKSLINLKKNFQKRIQFNHETNLRLQKMEQEITLKKEAVAKKLSLIQAQNFLKIKQIEQFQQNFLAQVKVQMTKNFEKQKKLKMQYEKISKQDSKITKTKQHQSRLDEETWKQIMNLKLNLQGLMSNQRRRQNRLVQQKDVEIFSKQEKIVNTKQQQKKTQRKRVKLDPKQAGRQYLDFAKKRGSVGTKPQYKLRKDYLNINLKVINYDNPILDVLSNNDGFLSKNFQKQSEIIKPEQTIQKTKNPNQNIQKWDSTPDEIQNDIIPILQQNEQTFQNNEFSDIEGIQQEKNI